MRQRFLAGRKAEAEYGARLRRVAAQVGELVQGFYAQNVPSVGSTILLRDMMNRYADLLLPWARSVASKMTLEVDRRDASAWAATGKSLGRALALEIERAPTGEALRKFMGEQVDLITSIPRKAAERVHALVINAANDSGRAEDLIEAIMNTGHVTKARASTIARTETSRMASGLTMVRAQYIGSTGYVWRTAGDSDVRKLHKKLEGQLIAWDKPPIADESGIRAHAGMIFNCRCWMEPVIPDTI